MKLFNFKKLHYFHQKEVNYPDIDPFIEISKIVRDRKIEKNLTTEDLSNISKIPVNTIIGIENNIKELIPQYPFTRSILLKLEECLELKELKLVNLLRKENIQIKKRIQMNLIINKFDIFNFWQGGFIYLLIIIISLFILNSYYLNNKVIEFKYIEKTKSNK